LEVRGERIAIRTAWTAGDAVLMMVAGPTGSHLPGAIVRHRALDREHAVIVVGNDQEEWF
jgi:hypothetical protein